jgi:putative YhbY family RNA-binding protein
MQSMTILELDSTTRSDLRSKAHTISPTVMIGTDGLTPGVLKEAEIALSSHELIKIRVLGDDREVRVEIYETICTKLHAAKVQHIGKLLVIYRPNLTKISQALPRKSSRNDEGFGSPRTVMVKKFTRNPQKRPKAIATKVLGNERVAAGGQIKRAKARPKSVKKRQLG